MVKEFTSKHNIEIKTPDGWQPVGKFFDKGMEQSLQLFFKVNGNAHELQEIKCSLAHRFQLENGEWIEAGDMVIGDVVIHEKGTATLDVVNASIEEQHIYDIEVLHPNHRYYSNGISSHNSGKTTLCLSSAVEAQKKGKIGVFIDTEQTFDYNYARALGLKVDNKNFAVFQPRTGEEVMELLKELAKTVKEGLDFVILDSIAMTKPEALLDGSNKQLGQHASFTQTLFNYFNNLFCSRYKVAVLAVNQLRRVPTMGSPYAAKAVKAGGVGAGYSQDDSWTTTGGQAYRYMMSMRFLLEQTKRYREEDSEGNREEPGNWVRITNVKNKLAPPFTRAEFVILFGTGVDDFQAIYARLKDDEYIYYSGGWYFVDDDETVIATAKKAEDFITLLKEEHFDTMKEFFVEIVNGDKVDPSEMVSEDGDYTIEVDDEDDEDDDLEDLDEE